MFSQNERLIYKYKLPDGKTQAADPLRLLDKMMSKASQEAVERDFKLLQIDKPESTQALLRLADLARGVFNLKELSSDGETGVTDSEALLLLVDFSQWVEEVQERFFTSANSANCTEAPSLVGESNR